MYGVTCTFKVDVIAPSVIPTTQNCGLEEKYRVMFSITKVYNKTIVQYEGAKSVGEIEVFVQFQSWEEYPLGGHCLQF